MGPIVPLTQYNLYFYNNNHLCIPGCLQVHSPPSSASQVMQLQMWTAVPGLSTVSFKEDKWTEMYYYVPLRQQ